MRIDSKVLAYLKGRGETPLYQVEAAVPETDKLVYASLRRLYLLGMVTKTSKRTDKSQRRVTHWKLNREWTPMDIKPQGIFGPLGM